MRAALEDPHQLGIALAGDTWAAWRVLLIAIMGEELTDDERVIFTALTGREREPLEPVEEFWGVVGRRGGKTRAMAVAAVYLAAFLDHSDVLALGERGMVPLIAASTKQAATAFRYILGLIETMPMLAAMVTGSTADTVSLSNGVDIEVRAASFRTARSFTAIAVLADEAAFWRSDDSANPDTEILNALRPALATTGGPLIVISSPYARRGEVYATWRRDFGPDGDPLILVAHGASRTLNPSLPQRVIDRAMARDPASAAAEYLAQFRSDIEAFVAREVVEACISEDVRERPHFGRHRYFAFVDPSGGSNDAMTLAIGHREAGRAVLDATRERKPPFSPEAVVLEFVELLRAYQISEVTGDRYAGDWVREPFRKLGVAYHVSAKVRSDLYRDMLPMLNSRSAELLQSETLITQLVLLERRVSRSGREAIDHAPGGHDDLANAVAGLLSLCAKPVQRMTVEPLRL